MLSARSVREFRSSEKWGQGLGEFLGKAVLVAELLELVCWDCSSGNRLLADIVP